MLATIGLTQGQTTRFIGLHGITGFDSFGMIPPDQCVSLIKSHNGIAAVAHKLGFLQQQGLQGFLYWYKCQKDRGQTIRAADFTNVVMQTSLEEYNSLKAVHASASTDIKLDPIESGLKWTPWKNKAMNILNNAPGCSNVYTLGAVIRPDKPTGWTIADAVDDAERRQYQAPHTGPTYSNDSNKVHNLLYNAGIGNPITAPWVTKHNNTKDGRATWKEIVSHCEGQGANDRRMIEISRRLSTDTAGGGLSFTNEYSNMTFDKYASELATCYQGMAEIRPPAPAMATQVTRLIDGIQVEGKLPIEMAKETIRNIHLNNWDGAVQHMAAKVTVAFPPKTTGRNNRYAKQAGSGGRGRGGRFQGRGGRGGRWGRGGGRGRGRGGGRFQGRGRGGGRSHYYNGVDLSEPTREFSNEEMRKLGREGFFHLRDLRRNAREDVDQREAKRAAVSGNDDKPTAVGSSGAKGKGAGGKMGKGAHETP